MSGKYTSNPSGNDGNVAMISIMFGQLGGGTVVLGCDVVDEPQGLKWEEIGKWEGRGFAAL
ncbi:hypothetical protein V1505DRAFT_423309, partial [Lipomyces doorenjongii]